MQLKQIIILGIALGFISCGKDSPPTKPPDIVLPDTTSHLFNWNILTFGGDAGSSSLTDVAIIDENNIWAVGEIYLQDSTGQFENPAYGAALWNGEIWQLQRLPARAQNRIVNLTPEGIFAFAADDIWFANGGVHHYDGQQIESFWVNAFPGNDDAILEEGQMIRKIWGSSSSNLWAVGLKGALIHYNGQTWQKINSGMEQIINDIWGVFDAQTQEYEIFCAVSSKFQAGEMKILHILPGNIVQEFDWQPQRSMQSVWFGENTPLYTCGDGFFMYEENTWRQVENLPKIYKNRVRGNHQFDVFIAGDFGLLAHFNGNSWKVFNSLGIPFFALYGLEVRDDIVVAVGLDGNRAVVVQGKRQK